MSDRGNPKSDKSSKASAGLAGATGGTVLVLLARQLPDSSPYKQLVLIIAPSLSVTLSAALLWLQIALVKYLELRKNEWLFRRVRTTLEKFLANPHTSVEHKEKMRQQLEELELARIRAELTLISGDK